MGNALQLMDIRTVERLLRAKWRWYLAALVLGFLATGLFLPLLDKGYKAEATIQLREEQRSPQLSSILSSLSNSDSYNSLDAVLGSRTLAERLAARRDVVDALSIDKLRGSVMRRITNVIETGLFGMDSAGEAGLADNIRQLLVERLSLSRSGTTSSVVSIEFSARSEDASKLVLIAIMQEADTLLRAINVSGLEERQVRVNLMLQQAAVESTRKSLVTLYERLGGDLISARSLSPYAFTVIDAPSAATTRSRPNFIIIWVSLTAMLFVMISAVVVFSAKARAE
ncbi:hypothetical protein GCM10011317_00150 [Niveispirillum cyanobacteriorum]|nr:hypothetical protein GCM10011317_00150 [Niveispirillum cyanobacteriorum]